MTYATFWTGDDRDTTIIARAEGSLVRFEIDALVNRKMTRIAQFDLKPSDVERWINQMATVAQSVQR